MSNLNRWQSSTALLTVVAITASTATPIVISAPAFAQATNFSDVSSDYWAKDFISALAAKGIIKGFPDGRFKPDSPVTRAEFGAMILKANAFKRPRAGNPVAFVDVPQSHWAFSAIQETYKTGFLKGYPGNTFRPNQNIPRAQVLVSLANGLGYSGGSPTTLQASYRDAASIPDFARNSVAAATVKRLVVNYPDINLINANRVATRAEVAASIYQALVSAGEAPAIASNFIPGSGSTGGGTSSGTGATSYSGGTGSVPLKANDDTAEVQSTTPVTIKVLDNDTAANTTKLTVASVVQGTNGKVEVASDQKSVTYTPATGFSGPTDSFSYTVKDEQGETATARVAVSFKVAPPQAKDDTAITLAEKPIKITVLDNDTAPEVANLKITDVTDGSNGTVTVPADKKSVTYTPKSGFTGPSDSFTYTISDAMGVTSKANVAVSFKQAAAPQPKDDNFEALAGQSAPLDVLKNDTAGEGTSLTVTQVTNPGNGTVVIAADKKSVTYTANAGFSGTTDSFNYSVSDGRDTATAKVNLSFKQVPASLPQAKDDNATTSAGKPVTVPALANDTGPDVANLKITDVTDGSNGTVTVPADKKSVTYTPKSGFTGPSDSFSYTISDAMGVTSKANVAISFKQAAAPQPKDDTATASSGQSVPIDVLKNDTAGEGTNLTISAITNPGNGTVAITADKKSVTYTPKSGVAGVTDKFIYTVSNEAGVTATANVAVTVGAASPLSARADGRKIPAGKPVTIDVLSNDSAPAGANLTISAVTPASNGKVQIANAGKNVVYTPNSGFAGTSDSFSYTVSDAKGNKATASVTVTVELAALAAGDDPATAQQGKPVIIDVLGNDRAPAGATLKLTIDKKPANGEAKVTTGNTITYTPKQGIAAGTTDSFSYTIEDGKGGKATANVTVTVTL